MLVSSATIRSTAVGGAVAALAALTISPAAAATGYDRCPPKRICVFTEPNGKGAIGIFQRGDADLGAAPGPSGLDNNIESVFNRSGQHWYFYPDRNYNGSDGISGIVPRGVKDTLSTSHHNKTSSLKPL